MKKIAILSVCLAFFSTAAFSQVTSVPSQAKENFANQYPNAQNVSWDNDVVNVNVRFDLDGAKMKAEYNNKGVWKSTTKDWTFEQVPPEVREGFKKSKYADRQVEDTKVIYLPGNVTEYRIKVKKNDVQKKYLYFNDKGRLVRDANTL
jgi:hypothetical protein